MGSQKKLSYFKLLTNIGNTSFVLDKNLNQLTLFMLKIHFTLFSLPKIKFLKLLVNAS